MSTLRIVLGDQLTRGLAALRDYVPGDTVLMMEVAEEATYVKHHKQKLVLVLSAMRHFGFRTIKQEEKILRVWIIGIPPKKIHLSAAFT